MLKTILVLSDGTELSSGAGTTDAIQSTALTECVNEGQELSPGSVCANMAEITVFTPGGGFSLAAGDSFTLYREDTAGERYKVGVFLAEKPERATANTLRLTAYDRITLLDQDLTAWLKGLTEWPYTLLQFAKAVCTACGLELVNEQVPNGDYPVQKFSADGITGRQLMKWVGQIAGRFCRATPEGNAELAWYQEAPLPEGFYYYQNGLKFSDYCVAQIDKVQLRHSQEDVGTVFPGDATGSNAYVVSGNYLLTAQDSTILQSVAQTLYEVLRDVTYTPCEVTVPATNHIHAGDILRFADKNGRTVTAYVMTKKQAGQRDTVTCTGSARRDSTTAVNNQSFQALTGKVLNLRTDVDGIKAENAATDGRVARLQMDVDGIQSEVSRQQESLDGVRQSITEIKQNATTIEAVVKDIADNGTKKVATTFGLTIDGSAVTIHRDNSDMTNSLDETGMYVIRNKGTGAQTEMLKANSDGVVATDVSVRNYLIIGSHARLEDYNDGTDSRRTACFWIGEGRQ